MRARDIEEVGRLLNAADSHAAETVRQRGRLRTGWRTATESVDHAQARLQAVDYTLGRRQRAFDDVMRNFDRRPDLDYARDYGRTVPEHSPDQWLQPNANGSWSVRPPMDEIFDRELSAAREKFIAERGKFISGPANRAGRIALARYSVQLTRLGQVKAALEETLRQATATRSQQAADGRTAAEAALAAARAVAEQAVRQLPAPLQPWGSPAWADWATSAVIPGLDDLYAGTLVPFDDADLGDNAAFGSGERIPFYLSLRRNLELVYTAEDREQALALARTLLIRQLAATAPGDMRMVFLDPVGLGQSVADFLGLAEFDPELVGGKAWSAPADLAAQLAQLTGHIELVIQKYLRTTYQTIDEFNAAAGEIAEPYRYLVVCDFPAGFTDETFGRLKSIMANGPRCGVRTLLLTSHAGTPGYGVDPAQLEGSARRITLGGNFVREHRDYTLQMRLDSAVDPAAAERVAAVIDSVGRRAVSRTESAVTFDKAFTLFGQVARRGLRTDLPPSAAAVAVADESTWWQADSTRGLFAPIGQKGARDAAILSFDSGDHAGALLVGRPGSGKSTLLHTLVGGLTTLYSPRELELYLVDFKEGVEFKAYAEEGLPHARMVAIESDREFGLSVLQSLEAELSRRGELLRATGGRHAGLQALREATAQQMPRALLIFDEFQVLFARNDKLGLAAASLLETIIRQGRGFGIHVLLGSQSLAGLDALGAHVPQLLPVRILLPAAEADARKVLGDGNDAGQYLTTHGDGILNAAGGAVEANERFKGALLPEPDRIARLRLLRARADAAGFTGRPTVFEGNASVPMDGIDPAAFRAASGARSAAGPGTAPVRLRAGAPMTTAADGDIELRREAGANVLAVVRDYGADDPGGMTYGGPGSAGPVYGLLAGCVALASLGPARIDVIDFMPADDGLDALFDPLLERGRITLRRRRAFAPLIEELRKEVRDRLQDDDLLRPARLAFLFGVHRARELDSDFGAVDADPELAEALEEVLRDGPEAGVHTWLWSDTVGGATRRLSSRMIRECGWRVAGKLSADDSLSLLGTDRAAELRDRQLLLANDDRGVLTRLMSYAPPAPAWLAAVLDGPPTPGGPGTARPSDPWRSAGA